MHNKCKINNYKFKKCLHLIQMMTKQTIEKSFAALFWSMLLFSEIHAQGYANPPLQGPDSLQDTVKSVLEKNCLSGEVYGPVIHYRARLFIFPFRINEETCPQF